MTSKPNPPAPITREDVIAHLHLLEPADVDHLVRADLVIPGRITTASHYRVTGKTGTPYVFYREGHAHVLQCATLADHERAAREIAAKRPTFALFTRVTLNPDGRPKAAPEPVQPAPVIPAPPDPVHAAPPPSPPARAESPERVQRREVLTRAGEKFLQGLITLYRLDVPRHHAADRARDAVLDHEFPPETDVAASADPVPPPPEQETPTPEPSGEPTVAPEPAGFTAAGAFGHTEESLHAMSWEELKNLARTRGIDPKSRKQVIAALLP